MLAKIAQCESGGNIAAVSPSGQYRGKYQFSQATWEALGGTGDPAEAEEHVQDLYAAKLYAAARPRAVAELRRGRSQADPPQLPPQRLRHLAHPQHAGRGPAGDGVGRRRPW